MTLQDQLAGHNIHRLAQILRAADYGEISSEYGLVRKAASGDSVDPYVFWIGGGVCTTSALKAASLMVRKAD